jgi:hypothetical protein
MKNVTLRIYSSISEINHRIVKVSVLLLRWIARVDFFLARENSFLWNAELGIIELDFLRNRTRVCRRRWKRRRKRIIQEHVESQRMSRRKEAIKICKKTVNIRDCVIWVCAVQLFYLKIFFFKYISQMHTILPVITFH